MATPVKFVQLVPVQQQWTQSPAGAFYVSPAGCSWTTLYALDDEGSVWWLNGLEWTPLKQPERPTPPRDDGGTK